MHYHKDMYFFQDLYNDDDDDFGIGYSCVKPNHKPEFRFLRKGRFE
jgi:hypothetical protein